MSLSVSQDGVHYENIQPTHCIIGVDPGDTTGLFVLFPFDTGMLVDYAQLEPFHVSEWVRSMLEAAHAINVPVNRCHVAIEKFAITMRTVKLTRQPAALEVTGVVRDVAEHAEAHTWEYGMSTSKKLASNQLLDRIGWVPGRGRGLRHVRDAARQAWSCLMNVDFPTWESAYDQRHGRVMKIESDIVRVMRNDVDE